MKAFALWCWEWLPFTACLWLVSICWKVDFFGIYWPRYLAGIFVLAFACGWLSGFDGKRK